MPSVGVGRFALLEPLQQRGSRRYFTRRPGVTRPQSTSMVQSNSPNNRLRLARGTYVETSDEQIKVTTESRGNTTNTIYLDWGQQAALFEFVIPPKMDSLQSRVSHRALRAMPRHPSLKKKQQLRTSEVYAELTIDRAGVLGVMLTTEYDGGVTNRIRLRREAYDALLHFVGFQVDQIWKQRKRGRFRVISQDEVDHVVDRLDEEP